MSWLHVLFAGLNHMDMARAWSVSTLLFFFLNFIYGVLQILLAVKMQ